VSRIYRYKVPVDDRFHEFALSGHVLSVGCRDIDTMEFWALETDGPTVQRAFTVVGTGHEMPPGTKHVGTAVAPGGVLVWHLVEATP